MDVLKDYIIYNWALILILIAFVIMLIITVFLNKKTVNRMYILIIAIFILSIVVFFEYYLTLNNGNHLIRKILIAIRYSATPIIISLIMYTLINKARWYVLIPALVLTIIDFISIFTGIVFDIDGGGNLIRGIFGYLPYIVVGLYSFLLVIILIKQSNKQITEIIPIVFLAFAFLTGIIFPFVIGKEYSKIFTTTIAIAIFVYYVFLILQLTKKDALTGLLNRQAYYAYIDGRSKDITALLSIDMNGLKTINDTYGHQAGDDAISTLASCLLKSAKSRQFVFRTGGDEFMLICYKNSEDEVLRLISRIRKNVSETKYSCSIGYCFDVSVDKNIEDMVKLSDEMMYADKEKYYKENGIKRRN